MVLLGIPALITALTGIFSSIVGFLATRLTLSLTIKVAAAAVVSALIAGFVITVNGLYTTAIAALQGSAGTAGAILSFIPHVIPPTIPGILVLAFTAEVARYVFDYTLYTYKIFTQTTTS